MLSYRQKLSKKGSIKTKSAKSDNKSLTNRGGGKRTKENITRFKAKPKTSKSSKLERKTSLSGARMMTPLIKQNNSDARLNGPKPSAQSYGLFYSPRDLGSKIININHSYTKNLKTRGGVGGGSNLVGDAGSRSKYMKRMWKKNNLLFDMKKGSKKKAAGGGSGPDGGKRRLEKSTDLNKKRSVKDLLRKKTSVKYIKKPLYFERKATERENLLQLINSRESIDRRMDNFGRSELRSRQSRSIVDDGLEGFERDGGSEEEDLEEEEIKGVVNPMLLKLMSDFKSQMKEALEGNKKRMARCVEGSTKI